FNLALYSFQGAFPAVLPDSLVRFPSALDYNTKRPEYCQQLFSTFFDFIFAVAKKVPKRI
ncbi:MAG: hypothetical protein KHX21_05670, partial [Clostridium sp.]|nr:hypothetical protein [Clostridium sp.]